MHLPFLDDIIAGMPGTNQFMQWAAQAICGQNVTSTAALGSQTMKLHSVSLADTVSAANAQTAASTALTWGAPAPTGGGQVKITASPVSFTVTAGGTAINLTHYGIYNGSGVFLYGKPLSSTLNIPAGQTASIQVIAEMTYEID